jgi:hypothetical protein
LDRPFHGTAALTHVGRDLAAASRAAALRVRLPLRRARRQIEQRSSNAACPARPRYAAGAPTLAGLSGAASLLAHAGERDEADGVFNLSPKLRMGAGGGMDLPVHPINLAIAAHSP